MRAKLRSATASPAIALYPCILGAVAAIGCNALSGIDEFAVEAEGSVDGTVVEGSFESDGAPSRDGGAGTVDASVDATRDTGDASREAAGDAAPEAMADGATDAHDAQIDVVEAGTDAANDAASGDAGCPVAHSNGLGQSYSDCTPLGTYNATQAFAACTAFTDNMALCANDPVVCGGGDQVCSSGSSMCACWRYNGTNAGHVLNGGATCQCLGGTSPTWN